MATVCKLCGKKLGIFDGFHSPAEVLMCDECYELYEKVLDSVSDVETFKVNLEEFQSAFSGKKEEIERIVKHLKDLHEIKLQETEEKSANEENSNNISSLNTEDNTGDENLNISQIANDNCVVTTDASDSTGMFCNIAGKIKTLAQVVTWIGIICSVIWGIVLMATDESLIISGLLIAMLGSLCSWVSSFVLYGFGQLIENTDKLVEVLKNTNADD